MIKIIDEKQCCGCGACKEVCPVQCITMKEGSLGHLFPVVNENECISCNKCEKVCPIINPIKNTEVNQSVYASYAKDDTIRKGGSSGGMFGTFASFLLKKQYLVYGASFDEKFNLSCTVAKRELELKPLMKSKYLQSDMSGKYKEIEENLKNGRKILFVSTPCQVVALKNYLGKEYENLITIDFFCHGVPSQKFFDKCLRFDEKLHRIKIFDYQFRTKIRNGSTPHYFTIKYKKGNKIAEKSKLYFDSSFYAAFQKYICLRESCYECIFSTRERASDITIADFHDINKYIKEIDRFAGCSTVIINTLKGERLWKGCNHQLETWEFNLQNLIDDGVVFAGGIQRPKNRDEFIGDYNNLKFDDFAKKWMNSKKYWKHRIYYMLPKSVRNSIKRFLGV